ncbi:MlaD family protein [Pseudomonas sp. LRF_L74]|uniref:MlaD family protein n=1 Tax=Pseudomonas sp. LRF_L74 TaxID=3369422 RepID=UPI003F5ED655
MEPRAHHVLIGLFTVITVGAALLFALWLGKSSSDQAFSEYEIIFDDGVSGLSPGSTVQYSGIKVGDVASLTLDPNDPRQVRALVRITGQTPIKQDTRARLSITGITGNSVIQLHGGTPESPLLKGDGKKPARIIADRSPLSRLMANGESVMIGVSRLLDRANQMFSQENADRIARTLEHLDQTTAAVAEQRDELRQALQQIGVASREAAAFMGNANQLLSGPGRESLNSAQRTLSSLETSSRSIERLIDENRDSINGGMQGFSDLGPAITELRGTLDALRAFSRRLEEDPSGYLLRGESVKEFKP